MQSVVTAILDSLATTRGTRVTSVTLEVGISGHFTEDAVRQYFQLLTRDTPAAGAALELTWLPASYQCLSCGQPFASTSSPGVCPQCGGNGWEVAHQDRCTIQSIEVEVPDL